MACFSRWLDTKPLFYLITTDIIAEIRWRHSGEFKFYEKKTMQMRNIHVCSWYKWLYVSPLNSIQYIRHHHGESKKWRNWSLLSYCLWKEPHPHHGRADGRKGLQRTGKWKERWALYKLSYNYEYITVVLSTRTRIFDDAIFNFLLDSIEHSLRCLTRQQFLFPFSLIIIKACVSSWLHSQISFLIIAGF